MKEDYAGGSISDVIIGLFFTICQKRKSQGRLEAAPGFLL